MIIAGVQGLDSTFSPDVYEYDLEVGVDMEMFFCSIIPMEEDSVVITPEDLTLDMGVNRFEVSVTAPAGNQEIYVFNITRLDHELEPETEAIVETESVQESDTEAAEEQPLEVSETITETELSDSESLAETDQVE